MTLRRLSANRGYLKICPKKADLRKNNFVSFIPFIKCSITNNWNDLFTLSTHQFK